MIRITGDGDPYFVSYDKSSITSYLDGITISHWVQTGTTPSITTTINTDDTYKIKVSGRYVLGVTIGGYSIGLGRNAIWNVSMRVV